MMHRGKRIAAIAATALIGAGWASAQDCPTGVHVTGTVLDPSGSAIVGAMVDGTVAGAPAQNTTTDAGGRFSFACLAAGPVQVTASAPGFQETSTAVVKRAGTTAHLTLSLPLAKVQTDVQVGNNGASDALDPDHGLGTHTLTGKDIQALADDPDDMTRELQVLAAANGGAPGAAKITVDGFQNGSALPPKSSIARIVTAPDLFSTEYQEAPYGGGRVEIYTKPGADSYHGALFFTDSDGSFNATDPFSVTATPASKRRYGFELTGPISKKKSDFNLALEKRDINEYNVVDALDLNADAVETPVQQTVSAPQRLWIASARGDWQVTPSDIATISFSANVNNENNQGAGGLTLLEAGYDSHVSEYDLRLTNTQTINANLLHETHIGFTWKDTAQDPLSTAPSLEVAGYFTGGGSSAGYLNTRERDLEIDDDVLYTHGRHSFKIGAQSLGILLHEEDPNTFNGAYTFGGGTAPALDANDVATGGTATIDPLEQYRRALLNLPGGTPTSYAQGTGTPLVPLAQWRLGLYLEDTVKLAPRLNLSGGLRYTLQSSPASYANFAPRLGLAWAIDKKSKTVVHLHAGLFADPVSDGIPLEAERLNGTRQQEYLIYSPTYNSPFSGAPGSVTVTTLRSLPASFEQTPSFQSMAGIEHDFPHHWHPQANFIYVNAWDIPLSRNINAPFVTSSNNTSPDLLGALAAPRPYGGSENIFQYQQTGHLSGSVIFLGLDQHSYKRFGFFVGYLHFGLTTDAPSNAGFVQNAYSNQGETARPDWQATHRAFAFANYELPWKASLTAEFDAQSGLPYNVTTGTDDNGDGEFNDRPSYASAPGTGVYSTQFGLLSTNAINGDVSRNIGTMPSLVHLDVNLSRAWKIGPQKADHPRTLTLNARSANLLNHTNVTAVGTIVGSPTLGESVAAEQARRVELGARFTF